MSMEEWLQLHKRLREQELMTGTSTERRNANSSSNSNGAALCGNDLSGASREGFKALSRLWE
jgi:hypothetical protein